MNHETNWLPGLSVLGFALLAAVVFLLTARRKHRPSSASAATDDLELRYLSLLAQLKEHAASKHLHSAEGWDAEQARLEQDAAAVLRQKAGAKHEQLKSQARAEKKAAAQAQPGGFSAIRGALWGAGVVAFFVLLGVVLSRETVERNDGQSMTGRPGAAPGAVQAEDPELVKLRAMLQRSPEDVELLCAAANALLQRDQIEEAIGLVRRATVLDPFHIEVRTLRAVVLAIEADAPAALAQLQHLATHYDNANEARMYAADLAAQLQQMGGAR